MALTELKQGDWCVMGDDIVQIKEVRDNGSFVVSTGWIETSGNLGYKLRPLTLTSKTISEIADINMQQLRDVASRDLNWPRIADWMEQAVADAIDGGSAEQLKDTFRALIVEARSARELVSEAIPGMALFRAL